MGPIAFYFPGTPARCLTTTEADEHALVAVPLSAHMTLASAAPTDVRQVLVGNRVFGSSAAFYLKGADGLYLTVGADGRVTCDAEAIGTPQEWQPVLLGTSLGAVAFQSVATDRFLSVDERSGAVRADADTAAYRETFVVRCQAALKRERTRLSKRERAEEEMKLKGTRAAADFEFEQT